MAGLNATTMHQSTFAHKTCSCRFTKPFSPASHRTPAKHTKPVVCKAHSAESAHANRRNLAALIGASPLLFVAQKASALIPANDDEDEELVSKAKANRSKKLVEEKGTEQGFANTAGYGGATVTTVERGVKKLAKSGSELEAGNLTAVAALANGSWVSEFQKAAEVVSTSSGAKSYVTEACNSIGKLGTSARQGDTAAAKQAFVSAVSSLQSWATDAKISVKGL